MSEVVDQIKDRLPIQDLVGRYVVLKKAGRNFKGLCPFHQEKTPSFVVSPEKGLAYCFGCNQGGDVLAFYQLVERCDFNEAVQKLADELGLEYKIEQSQGQKVDKSLNVRLKEQHDLAVEYYKKQLWETESGQKVLQYIRKRGLSDSLIKEFALGYAPKNSSGLLEYLQHSGADSSAMLESGLIVTKETVGSTLKDRFQQRLMVPIANSKGEWIAFGGRALEKGQEPKYLNSPETNIYHKQQILFGLDKARPSLRQQKQPKVYLVEGYFDVFAFHIAGLSHAVATCGTSLTEGHVRELKRYVEEVVLAFDQDSAGRAAAWRAVELLFASNLRVSVLLWDGGKDPAEIVQSDPQKLKDVAENNTVDFWEYVWRIELEDGRLRHKPEVISSLKDRALDLIAKIQDPVLRDLAVRRVSQVLQVRVEAIYDGVKIKQREGTKMAVKSQADSVMNSHVDGKQTGEVVDASFRIGPEALLWGHLALAPELFSEFAIELESLADLLQLKAIYKAFVAFYNDRRLFATDFATQYGLPEAEQLFLNKLVLYLETKEIDRWSHAQVRAEIKLLIDRLTNLQLKQKLEAIQWELQAAEARGDKPKVMELLAEYSELLKHQQNQK